MALIFHLAVPSDWESAQPRGVYDMSTRGVTLAQEGFIHCSYPHQVNGVAGRYYADLDELILLTVDTEQLDVATPVRDEAPAPGSSDMFPHIYGPIPASAVVEYRPIRRDPGATWSIAPP